MTRPTTQPSERNDSMDSLTSPVISFAGPQDSQPYPEQESPLKSSLIHSPTHAPIPSSPETISENIKLVPGLAPICQVKTDEIRSIKAAIEILHRDGLERNRQIFSVFQRLDATISQLQNLSLVVTQMITKHDQQIHEAERSTRDRKQDTDMAIKEFETTILSLRQEFTVALDRATSSIVNSIEQIKKSIAEQDKEWDVKFNAMEGRVKKLEYWRWFVVGSSAVIIWILTQLPQWIATNLGSLPTTAKILSP